MEPNYKLISGLASGPDTHIGARLKEILAELDEKPVNEVRRGLHKALDFGARYALASDFVMKVLDLEWKRLGGKHSDPAPWREEIKKEEE